MFFAGFLWGGEGRGAIFGVRSSVCCVGFLVKACMLKGGPALPVDVCLLFCFFFFSVGSVSSTERSREGT